MEIFRASGTPASPPDFQGLEMEKRTKIAIVGMIDYFFQKFLWLTHLVLSVIYFRQKQSVPRPQDPLLLKSATHLAEGIRKRTLSSKGVMNAYIARIREVEPYINATVEQGFECALMKARAVDELVASGKYTEEQLAADFPLLGVPISVKALLHVKGFEITACSKLYKGDAKATESSQSVSLMQAAGAIVIAITNCPEFGLSFATYNHLYGRTCNPYDTTRTCGGSSGGEGALIGAAGSVIGLGNDMCGSIRIPSHFNGIFGHKPSRDLVPNDGFLNVESKIGRFTYTGPMCRYAEDLITTMRVLSSRSVARPMFGKEVDFKKLKIYYLLEIKDYLAAPAENEIKQSIRKAATHFRTTYGSAVKQTDLRCIKNANNLTLHILAHSAGDLKKSVAPGKGDSISQKWDFVKYFFGKSVLTFSTLLSINFSRNPIIYKEYLVPRYQKRLEDLAKELEDLLDEDSVLLMPTFPVTAPHHNGMLALATCWGYTAPFNFLGLPVTHCPLGLTKKGLPFGTQIVGRMNNDPLTIACAVELEKVFGGWILPGKVNLRV